MRVSAAPTKIPPVDAALVPARMGSGTDCGSSVLQFWRFGLTLSTRWWLGIGGEWCVCLFNFSSGAELVGVACFWPLWSVCLKLEEAQTLYWMPSIAFLFAGCKVTLMASVLPPCSAGPI